VTADGVRAAIRDGTISGPTERLAPDHVQANLVVVPREYAEELADLCARNPVPCPVIEQLATARLPSSRATCASSGPTTSSRS
jgi:uncharacterized protein YcsI (UPF0317 family)